MGASRGDGQSDGACAMQASRTPTNVEPTGMVSTEMETNPQTDGDADVCCYAFLCPHQVSYSDSCACRELQMMPTTP
jgi:hypothetical protein